MSVIVLGMAIDDQTRCVHYSGPYDVVALKFKCCRNFYPCFRCHAEKAGHAAQQWPADEWDEEAVLCGVCQTVLTIRKYVGVLSCPCCSAPFNAGCRLHRRLYFAATADAARPDSPAVGQDDTQ